jgi:hypothetical protein
MDKNLIQLPPEFSIIWTTFFTNSDSFHSTACMLDVNAYFFL